MRDAVWITPATRVVAGFAEVSTRRFAPCRHSASSPALRKPSARMCMVLRGFAKPSSQTETLARVTSGSRRHPAVAAAALGVTSTISPLFKVLTFWFAHVNNSNLGSGGRHRFWESCPMRKAVNDPPNLRGPMGCSAARGVVASP
jgi:hypothetical protein